MSVLAGVLAAIYTLAGHPVTPVPSVFGLIAAACALGYAPFARLFRQIIAILPFDGRHDPIRSADRDE